MRFRFYPPSTNLDYGGNLLPPKKTTGGSSLTLKDEGASLGTIISLDVVGATATASIVGAAGTLTIAAAPAVGSSTRWDNLFGDGSDGDVAFDGSAVAGYTLASSVYTANASTFKRWNNCAINSGITVRQSLMSPLLVNGTLSGSGVIDGSGANAAAAVGGVAVTGAYYTQQPAGGAGNTNAPGVSPMLGNVGGAGGAASGGPGIGGGATGSGTAPSTLQGGMYYAATPFGGMVRAQTITNAGYLGGGSGGGGFNGTASGGAGGAGGHLVVVFARYITFTGTIRSHGGDGAAGFGAGADSGGGGGGGGGCALLITTTSNWASLLTTDFAGGNGGAPKGAGKTGTAGSTGRILSLVLD